MAQIMPDSPKYYDTGSNAEVKIFDSLKNKMPDEWIIIHSFRWIKSKPNSKGKPQGEGDFILFHPNNGIMVLEVKGGDINYKNHTWSTTNNQGNEEIIQDPEKQASDTKFEIINRLKARYLRQCFVCHAVWFPDINKQGKNFPANVNEFIVLDESSLDDPEPSIKKAFMYWYQRIGIFQTTMSASDQEKILRLLNPEFRMVKTMKSRCDDTHILYVRLNSEQARLLDMLEECREVHVTGRAGTGKTILALEKGRIDSSKNRRTILLCYNNELAQRLAESSDDPAMEISSIHSYALAYLNRYHPNRVLGFSDSPDFDYLMNEFVEVAYDPHEEWDTILIDEGQDFKESWITSIHRLLTDHGNFYIFYDPHQYLYAPVTEFEDKYLRVGIPITLKRNMRNTDQISQACMNILNKPVEEGSLSGVTGICPEILVFDKESIPNALETVLYKLRYSERIDDERISVITLKTENTSIIPRRVQESIPEFKTVRKFKGLENDIVLIVDVELKHLIDPTQQRLLYVALSRARVHSIIFIKIDARYKQYLLRKWNVTNDNLASKIRDYIIGGNL